jgi:tetratricopeptide (TPR) repeat protein
VARPEGQAGGLSHDVSLRRALVEALPFVDKSFAGQPLIEARLRRTLGLSFHYLGEESVAAQQFQASYALYMKHRGPDHVETLAIVNNLANSYAALGRPLDAIHLRKEVLMQRRSALGLDDPATLDSMSNLANSYDAFGEHLEALKLRQETLALRQAKLGRKHPDTLAGMNNLAISYSVLGRHDEALKLREETLAFHKGRPVQDYPSTLAARNNLAESYQALGRYQEALKHFEETLALAKVKLKNEHPNTLLVMNNIAWLLATADDAKFRDPARAVELAAKAASLSPNTADYSGTLGTARYRSGDWKQAALDLQNAIRIRGANDCRNANESFFLAMTNWRLGDQPAARKSFDLAVAWMDKGKLRDDEVRRFRAEAADLLGITK